MNIPELLADEVRPLVVRGGEVDALGGLTPEFVVEHTTIHLEKSVENETLCCISAQIHILFYY